MNGIITNKIDLDYFPIGQETRLLFHLEYQPVSIEDFQFEQLLGETAYSLFKKIGYDEDKIFDFYTDKFSGMGHKIGGYAYFTQSDPRYNQHQDHIKLLLQIDTDDELNIMWGDAGVANFFINEEDLKRLDFSNVLYNWDCC